MLFFHGTMRRIGAQIAGLEALQPTLRAAHETRSGLGAEARRSLDAALDTALAHLSTRSDQASALLEGLCDGLARDYDRHDMLYVQLGTLLGPGAVASSECGAITIPRDSGHLLGQNLDLGVTNDVALCYMLADDGPARLCHINLGYGIVTVGINEFGVSYGGGSVNASRPFERTLRATYTAFLSQLILGECRSASEAPDVLRRAAPFGPSHDGFSCVVVDGEKNVNHIEGTGPDLAAREVSAPVVVAANHFALPEMTALNRKNDPAATVIQENSLSRKRRAREHFEHTETTREALASFLRSGRGGGHWCRSARWPDVGWTTASYIFDPANSRVDYWLGIAPANPARRTLDMSFLFERRALA